MQFPGIARNFNKFKPKDTLENSRKQNGDSLGYRIVHYISLYRLTSRLTADRSI